MCLGFVVDVLNVVEDLVDVEVDDDTDNVDSVCDVTRVTCVDTASNCSDTPGASLLPPSLSPPRSPAPHRATPAPAPSTRITARTAMAMVTVLELLGVTPS